MLATPQPDAVFQKSFGIPMKNLTSLFIGYTMGGCQMIAICIIM